VSRPTIIDQLGWAIRRGGSSRLFGAGVVTLVGYVATALIGIAGIRIFTELASPRVFGGANLILTMTTLATTLFVAPITNTQIRYHTEAGEDGAERFTSQVVLCGVAVTAAIALVTAVSWAIWRAIGIPPVGLAGLFGVLLLLMVTVVRNVVLNRLQAERRQAAYILSIVAESVLLTSGVAIGISLSGTADGYVLGQATAALVFLLLLAWTMRRTAPLRFAWRPIDADFRRKVWDYGAPFAPIGILTWLSNLADRYVLALVAGTAPVGRYTAPFSIANRGMGLLNAALSDVFRPVLFEAVNNRDGHKARVVFGIWLVARAISAAGTLGFIYLFGANIAAILLGPQYREGAPRIMMWIAFAYAFYGTTQVLETRLMSFGYSSKLILPLIVGALANVALSVLWIPRDGALGAAHATTASFVLQFATTLIILVFATRTHAAGSDAPRTAGA
jgi:O-antigen/teichoic acid export membrane protein